MSIRRQWLIVLFLVAILSVAINTLVLGSLTDKTFKTYIQDSYDEQLSKIVEYSKEVLLEDSIIGTYTNLEVDSYLVDPISQISIYDAYGNLVITLSNKQGNQNAYGSSSNGMGKMMNHMMGSQNQEVDLIDVISDGKLMGRVRIIRSSAVENSIATRIFMANLFDNSLKSVVVVLFIALLIGIVVSKKMSKELVLTANKAQSIELGNKSMDVMSKVKEIQVIEHSLDSLKMKLDIRQRSRKKLIDELIHQTRTPLTILKTHIEAYEDGLIDLNNTDTTTLINEIDNVTSIISNLGPMIDGEKDYESINIGSFKLSELVNQICSGLKLQFEKKQIDLLVRQDQPIIAKTDRYKLSQVIYNVITNAYKYTDKGGSVFVEIIKTDEKIQVIITDTGIGIRDEDKNKIFNAYFRSPRHTTESGDGIGLYVARENMRDISGDISLDQSYKDGSKFIIEFRDL